MSSRVGAVRLGIADHLGWAVAVTAKDDHEVVDRRRIELVEPGVSQAPIHYDRGRHDAAGLEAIVADAKASVGRATAASLDELAASVPGPIASISLRTWPPDFPDDIETQMRVPYEARADAIMYRTLLAEAAATRGWTVHRYDARRVIGQATDLLGDRATEVLDGPRRRLGAPWAKDHRVALAATIVAAAAISRTGPQT